MAVNLSPVGGVAGQFFDNNGNPLSGGKIFTYAAGTTTNQVTYTSAAGVTAHSNPIILDSGGRVPSGEIWLTDGLQYKFVIKTSTDQAIGTFDNIVGINSNFVNFTTSDEVQIATAGQTVFTLTTMSYQPGTNNLVVYVDGVNQVEGGSYSYVETDSTIVTFTAGLHLGAVVKFVSAEALSTNVATAADTIYVPAGTGAVTTTVQTKLRETVSVQDFGAVGDGVADDTAAIQAAVNSGASEIHFPSGTYLMGLTDQIVIGSDVTLIGEHQDTVTVKIATAATFDDNYLFLVSGNNVNVKNISFDGGRPVAIDSKSTEKKGKIGFIQLLNGSSKVNNIAISQCRFLDAYAKGVEVYADNVTISDCTFERIGRYQIDVTLFDGAVSTWVNNTDAETNITIKGCNFSYVGQYAAILRNSNDVVIENNNVEYSSAIGFGQALSKNIRIKNNYLKFTYNGGIDLQQCSYSQIDGNTLELCGNGTQDAAGNPRAYQSIYFGDDFGGGLAHHAVITNNVVYGNFSKDIISGTPPSGYVFAGQGIEVIDANDVVISSNVIDGVGRGYTTSLLQSTKEGVGI